MMRPFRLGFMLLLLAFGFSLPAGAAGSDLTYVDLVGSLTNLERLADLPVAGETSAEWTSRDRASGYEAATSRYVNWEANDDGNGFIRTQPDGGVVMAEMTGPGCIWRIWSAQVGSGHVKVFLDGADTPAVDLAFADYFNRNQAPFNYPALVYTACGGFNSYVPIPYRVSCKVVAYGSWGRYFHFNYSTFPAGTTVPTFSAHLTDIEQNALARVNDFFLNRLGTDPAGNRHGEVTTTNGYTIAPGQSITALDFGGAGAITTFKVRVKGLTGAGDQWATLRELTVSMAWDDEAGTSVWAPLGDFFGSAGGYIPYTALPLGMQTDGWMYCHWYMPFASRAKISLGNDGGVSREVEVIITRASLAKSAETLARFHAKWNRGVYVTDNGRSPDYRFLTTSGRGRLVGLTLHVYQAVAVTSAWWGEGDEKFFVDGEKMPSWFGTGSEDYFGFAWGTPGYFSKAYHTQALAPAGNLMAPGNRALNRFHIVDNVPFQTAFEGCLEKWQYTNDTITTYGTLPYWYLAAGGSDPYGAVTLSARTNYYQVPAPPFAFTWTNPAGGGWSVAGNWADNRIASGSGQGANFGALDLSGTATVQLDSLRVIGSLFFGDTDPSTAGGWVVDNSGNVANSLTLAGPAPMIHINALSGDAAVTLAAGINCASSLTRTGDGTLVLGGTNSLGGLIINGGTNRITGRTILNGTGGTYFFLGNADPSYQGALVIEPGAMLGVAGNWGDNFVIGRDGGSGTVVQNGGTFNYNPANESYWFVGASMSPDTRAEYDLNGGVLDLNGKTLSVGFGAGGAVITGRVNQVGGMITNVIALGLPALQASGWGQYNLSGGSLCLGSGGISSTSGKYEVNLGGGTIAASAVWSSALNMILTGLNGDVTFDTKAYTITLAGTLTGEGGLIKAGSGTLVLGGARSYRGDTMVKAGTLRLNAVGAGDGAIRLAGGAVLNLNFSGTNAVRALFTNQVALPAGIYRAGDLPGFLTGLGAVMVGGPAGSDGRINGIVFTNGTASLIFDGLSNCQYHVQISTNLNHWADVLVTNAPTDGRFQFNDGKVAMLPAAYYRLMWNGN